MTWRIFRFMRRTLTGEVVHKVDVEIDDCIVSIRLKRNKDELYVVMAFLASGDYQYYPLDIDQFKSVTQALLSIKAVAETSENSH
jgi:hypothetical protein